MIFLEGKFCRTLGGIIKVADMSSKILYTCIAERGDIVAEAGEEGYQELIHALLREIEKGEKKLTRKAYVHEETSFNYIATEDSDVYIAVWLIIIFVSLNNVQRFVMKNFQLERLLHSFNTLRITSIVTLLMQTLNLQSKWYVESPFYLISDLKENLL